MIEIGLSLSAISLISRDDFMYLTRDDLEAASIAGAEKDAKQINIHGHYLDDKTLGLYYKIYGFNQEGLSAFFRAMSYATYFGALNLGQSVYSTFDKWRNNSPGIDYGNSSNTNTSFNFK